LHSSFKTFADLSRFVDFAKKNLLGKKLPSTYLHHDGGIGQSIEVMIHGRIVGPGRDDVVIAKEGWEIKVYTDTLHIGSTTIKNKDSKELHIKKCENKMKRLIAVDCVQNYIEIEDKKYSVEVICKSIEMYTGLNLKLFNDMISTRKGTNQTKFESRIDFNNLIQCYDDEVLDIAI